MGTYDLKQTCTRGEISALVRARRDLDLYKAGMEKLTNWVVLKQGGIRRRSGTRFMGEAHTNDYPAMLMSYTFNTEQSYVIEWTPDNVRFWVEDGLVLTDADDIYVLTSPYPEPHVDILQNAPYNDVIYLAGPHDIENQRLKRFAHNVWSFGDADFTDGPYLPINDVFANKVNVNAELTTGTNRTLVWPAGVTGEVELTSDDVGRLVRLQFAGKWSYGKIAAVTPPRTAVINVLSGQGGSGDTASWRLGAYYNNNWPGSVAFYESRLVWANTPSHPRALGISRNGLPSSYAPSEIDGTVEADHGMFLDIIEGQADPILWMVEGSRLLLGTASAIRSVGSGSSTVGLSPANATHKREVKSGASAVLPLQVGSSTIFPARTGKALHDMFYDLQTNGLTAPDMSLLSAHLLKFGVVEFAYQDVPESIAWCRTGDGKLFGVTLDKAEKVVGYHPQDVGGVVESIAILKTPEEDQLWMTVKRTIDGATKRYIEVLEKPFDSDLHDLADAFFVDCGVSYDGVPATTIAGLDHLEGEEVALLGDGAVLPNVTVSGGSITIPNGRSVSKAQIGLPMTATATTLPAPVNAPDGSTMGRKKRAANVIVDVIDTSNLKLGSPDQEFLEAVEYRKANTPMGEPSPLLDGQFEVKVDGTWDGEARIKLVADTPLPATVLALNINVVSEP